ncbi:MAG: PAS domain S-box protein [Geobacteraceae bacterium]|jgi:PAS domain S-box-containing protein
MKQNASDRDPAFPVMAMDILSNVLSRADNPGDLGTYLTEEVRDLTGARCVLLIQCLSTTTMIAHRVVSVNPLRRREWAESPAGNRLYEVVHRMPAAQLWRGEEPPEVAGLLRQEGFELSMVFPLNAGGLRVGAMLVLGLPDEEHITSVLSLLNNLSAIVALVLRNTILYEKQEQLIQERTAELRDNNEKLAMELAERMRAEEALRESEEKYRTIFQNSPLGIFRSSFEGRFLDVNPATAKILGYDSPEAVIREIYNIAEQIYVHTGDRQRIVSEQLGSSDITSQYVNRFRRKDGIEFIANLYLKTIHDAEGRPIYLQGIVEDITERKRTERDIALMNFALNNVHEAAFLIDENAHFNYVNEYVCRALGYSRDELLGLGVPDVDPDFPAELWPSHWEDLKTRGSLTFEGRHRAKDGSIFPVEVNANYFEYDGKGYNLALVRDITGRMRAEEERLANLRFLESMDRINRAIQGTNDLEQMMSDVLETVLSIFDCDRAFLLYPCDPEAESWTSPMERTTPEYPGVLALGLEMPMDPDVAETLRLLLASDGPVQFGPGTPYPLPEEVSERFGFKCFMSMALHPKVGKLWQFGMHQCSYPRIWTPDEERLFLEIGRRLADALTSLTSHRDLRESEARYRRIVDTASEGIWVVGPDIRTISVNARMAEMLGYPSEEIIGRPFTDFMFEEDLPDHLKKIENRRQGMSENYERRFRRKDGETLWTQASATPILDNEHRFIGSFAMFTDITDRKRAEETLNRLNEELEQRVKQRTVELEEKNKELNRMNKLFIGRELRMIELKKRIRELEIKFGERGDQGDRQ